MAAVEMRLDSGWKTYWRTPGAGGLPTQFDFTASRNITDVTGALSDAAAPQ